MKRARMATAEIEALYVEWSRSQSQSKLDELCQGLQPLADNLCRKMRSDLRGADFEEALDEARQAVLRAVLKYKPTHGAKLTTYTCAAIIRAVSTFRRGGPIHVPRGDAFRAEKEAAMRTTTLDVVESDSSFSPVNRLDAIDQAEIVTAVNCLQKRDSEIVRALFFEDRTIAETAIRFNLTASQVMTARDRALNALRRDLSDYAPARKNSGK